MDKRTWWAVIAATITLMVMIAVGVYTLSDPMVRKALREGLKTEQHKD